MCVACRPRKDDYISSLPPEVDPFRPSGPSDGPGVRPAPCLDTLGVTRVTGADFAQPGRGFPASGGDAEALGDLPPPLASSAAAICDDLAEHLDRAMGGTLAAVVGDPPAEGALLSGVSEKDKIWDKVRLAARQVTALYLQAAENASDKSESSKFRKWASKIAACSRHLCFEELNDGKLRLRFADFCRTRWCPVCAWRKSLALKARMYNNISDKWDGGLKDCSFISLVLTVKNCALEDLNDTLVHMQKSFIRLFDRAKVKRISKGYIKSLEITFNRKTVEAHPHFHITIAVDKKYFSKDNKNYIKHEEWVKLWKESGRFDYDPSVSVKKVKNNKKSGKVYDDDAERDGLITALLETVKYQIKSKDLSINSDFLAAVSIASEKKRFIAATGVFKGIFANKKNDSNEAQSNNDDGFDITDDEMMLKNGNVKGKAKYLQIYTWCMKELYISEHSNKKKPVWAYRLAKRQENDIDEQPRKYRECFRC